MSEAADITRRAKSNLAFAFALLPKERRADCTTFYAFCRVIDDIALVRSMWTTDNNHVAQLQFHTGKHRLDGSEPAIGAWASISACAT